MTDIWHVKEEVPQEQGKQILVRFQDDCGFTVKVMSNVQEYLDEYYETSWLKWAYVDDVLNLQDKLDRAKFLLMQIAYLDMTEHGIGSNSMMINWCKAVAHKALEEIEQKGNNNE